MSFRRDHKGRQARAQAMFVALLYVFLSTFGTLTHSHVSRTGLPHAPTAGTAQCGDTAVVCVAETESGSCAFCEWQASSVSTALQPLRIATPLPERYRVSRLIFATRTPFLARFSSRAPPVG